MIFKMGSERWEVRSEKWEGEDNEIYFSTKL